MDDLDAIISAYDVLRAAGKRGVLATLVDVQGAAFRKIGARMLIDEDGRMAGGISAGCLEADIAARALEILTHGDPVIARYDTGGEQEILFGWGAGCDGILTVLLEPLALDGPRESLAHLARRRSAREEFRIATVFEAAGDELPLGTRIVSSVEPELPEKGVIARLICADLAALPAGTAQTRCYETAEASVSVLLEHIAPQPRLVILGAGPVASPLALFAAEMGWDVIVMDRRSSATADRFSCASRVITADYDSLGEQVSLDGDTAVVLMTHNFLDDAQLLRSALDSEARGIFILGSRGRARKLFDALETDGRILSCDDLARIHAPAGLEVGAKTPAQIALSIVAEVQQVFSGGSARPLRERATPEESAWQSR
jgi:xanthine/CO dehydrogenase XdhC/CoxF family maturation factor